MRYIFACALFFFLVPSSAHAFNLEMACDITQAKADTNLMVKDQKGNVQKDTKGNPRYILNLDYLKICPAVGKMHRGDLVSLRGSSWPQHTAPYQTSYLKQVRFIDVNTGLVIATAAGFYGKNETGNGSFTTYFFVPRFDQFKPGSYFLELWVHKTECPSQGPHGCILRKFKENFPVEVLPDPAPEQPKVEKKVEQPKQVKPVPVTPTPDIPKDTPKPIAPPKTYNPTMILPSIINQDQELNLVIENAHPGSKVNRIYFGNSSAYEQYVDIPPATTGSDGKIRFAVTVPSRADLAADPETSNFAVGSIAITPAINDSTGLSFWQFANSTVFRGMLTRIPLLCQIPTEPSIIVGDKATYDQRRGVPEITFSAAGFTCYDKLSVVVSGIRMKGKPISSVHTSDHTNDGEFFRYGSGAFVLDRLGRTPWDYRLSGAPLMDPDVTQITLTVSDRHNRSISAPVKVIHPLHDYDIAVKDSDTDPSNSLELNWRGFKNQPKSQLTLENEKLLSKKPVLLGSFYLDSKYQDEEGRSVITFKVPEDIPNGDYVLRMKQGEVYATTLYTVKRKSAPQPKTDEKKKAPPIAAPDKQNIKTPRPCTGLTGYMLRQCKQAYDILDETKDEQKQEKKITTALCSGLEGYMLRSCKESYGLLSEIEKKPDLPIGEHNTDVPCQGLMGYLLRSCQSAYGSNVVEEKKPEEKEMSQNESAICANLEGYMLRQCESAYGVQIGKKFSMEKKVTSEPAFVDPTKLTAPPFVEPLQPEKSKEALPESKPAVTTQCQTGFTYSPTFGRCLEDIPIVKDEVRPTCPEGQTYSITLRQCLR